MSSRYTRKRKHDLDQDTTENSGHNDRDEKTSSRRSSRKQRRESSGSPPPKGGGNDESLSIEETNKLRASLGLPPLEVDDGPKNKEDESEETSEQSEKVVVEDGMEFVHKAAESWTQKKASDKLKEKIETKTQKRVIQSKVLKAKGLADSDSEDEGVASWVEKNRKLEEERKKAEQKAKELDQLDEEIVQSAPKKVKRPRPKPTDALSGMTVGHSKSAFLNGEETILVLDDKSVLDEDGEEVLVNPTLMYNEQLKKNKDLRNKKSTYNPYDDEEIDEFGVVKKKNLLAKYDEGVDGPETRETFKLDQKGGVNLADEEEEQRVKRNLFMANRKLQSLETPKYKIAAEFYTEEEMISFRKPKKKKDGSKSRKRKGKGEDIAESLKPEEETEAEKQAREERLRARRGEENDKEVKKERMEVDEREEGEIVEQPSSDVPKQRFRDTMGGTVDTNKMRSLLDRLKKEQDDDDEEEEDFEETNDLAGVVIDDDVEDELSSALEKARKLKLLEKVEKEKEDGASKTKKMLETLGKIKEENSEDEMEVDEGQKRIVFDSTSEFYKTIGDLPSYGLAGNRDDEVDYSEILAEQEKELKKKESEESSKKEKHKKDKKKKHRRSRSRSKSRTPEDEKMEEDIKKETTEYVNVLGKEKDVTKGVAGMLKLASEKGYLEDPNAKKNRGGTLKHLESKCVAKVEFSKYDIEDKYLKKMERLGTTGSGPLRSFPEKKDYQPQIDITYTDSQGKEIDPKNAFKILSYKFHGKAPGKKQVEKRMRQQDKKERLKKMNSSDTPLGTLTKQRSKQEQLQTPYLILSGSNRDNGLSLQKD